MISEIMKFVTVVNFTQLYLHTSLESHVEGILTLSYHPSGSSIRNTLAYVSNFSSTVRIATSPLRVSVDRESLGSWLAMNLSLSVAGVLVYLVLRWAETQTARDMTLASLMSDLSGLAHSERARARARGFSGAVALRGRIVDCGG
jgi:hypothetical protein